jgi:3-oxoacyl-[acyl-carrier protein] reductase
MLLRDKTAVVYGGGGAIGAAVAKAYAREGAHVFLAGRTTATLDRVAAEIRRGGSAVEVAAVNALDPESVRAHADHVEQQTGGIDVAFNATSNEDVQGMDLIDMPFDDFLGPVVKAVTVQFVIGTTVGAHMKTHGGGVILVMAGGREAIPALGGSHVAWSALAGLCRQLASELSPHGVRVLWLLSPGSPDSSAPDSASPNTLLRRLPSLNDVANAATFVSSDWAKTMTATELNLTGGAVID